MGKLFFLVHLDLKLNQAEPRVIPTLDFLFSKLKKLYSNATLKNKNRSQVLIKSVYFLSIRKELSIGV
jgi:hypothetical protein